MAKRKMRLDNLRAPIYAFALGSAAILSSCPSLVSCPGSPTCLSSCPGSFTHFLPLFAYFQTFIALSSCLMPALVSGSLAVLLLLSVLSLTLLHLVFTAFKIFKQALLDKSLHCSTNFAGFFYLFPSLSLLLDKTNCKQTFNTAIINSRPLASNYARKKFNLSFAECGCLATVKLNQLWQLKLLNIKPVCII